MKKHIFLFLLAIFLSNCGSKPKSVYYTLQGKISDAEQKKVIIKVFDKKMQSYPIDTVLIQDSVFKYVFPRQNPHIAIIEIESFNTKIPVIIGDGDIIINIDKNQSNPFKYDISSSTSILTKKLFEYEKYAQKDKEKGMILLQKYRIAATQKEQDSIKKEYEKWQKNAEKYQYDYIVDNKDYVGLIVMQSILSSQNADIQKVRNNFAVYPESVKTTNLGKFINTFILTKGATEIGGKAPNFIGTTPDGKKLSLNQAMGKVTIIDFWASWCKPCRIENPYVVELYNQFHNQGLNIIGVSLDKNKQSWLKAIKDDGLKWQHVSSLKFWHEPIAKQYAVTSIPQTFILDAKGIIRAKNLRREALKKKVIELLNE